MKRNIPDTSKLADYNFKKSQRETHYKKIVDALKVLGLANGYEIALFLKMEHVQINRRLHELRKEDNPRIYRTETKHKTERNNFGYCYALVGDESPKSIYDAIMEPGIKTEDELRNGLKPQDLPPYSHVEKVKCHVWYFER